MRVTLGAQHTRGYCGEVLPVRGYERHGKSCPMSAWDWFKEDISAHETLAKAWVVPEPSRCVQCGICSFHCPMGIDVRRHVWLAQPVADSHCLTCGECVKRCPRGLLRFERVAVGMPSSSSEGGR